MCIEAGRSEREKDMREISSRAEAERPSEPEGGKKKKKIRAKPPSTFPLNVVIIPL